MVSDRSATAVDVSVPGYQVIRKIADGGSASIFKAKKEPFEQVVALKVLLARCAGDKEMVAAFDREATVLGKLKHRNIVKFGGVVKGAPRPTYEMELFEGTTLEELIARRQKLPVAEAAKVLLQIAEALSTIHVQGYAHLDIRPDNVLVSDKLEARLIDFSICRETKQSIFGRLVGGEYKPQGTVTYLSPEQIQAQDPGAKADVYALGLCLFEALTGAPPFKGLDQKALMKMHLSDVPPPLDAARPDCPPDVVELVRKSLEKDPLRRPDTTAVAQVLARHAR
jgi:serine/threonine-protein kinase